MKRFSRIVYFVVVWSITFILATQVFVYADDTTVIGESLIELDGTREHVRTGETNLGNLIADSFLKESGADVAITNGGGIRESIPAGKITFAQAQKVLPFDNHVLVIEVSGQDIVDALTHGCKDFPAPFAGFPHVAGMSFKIYTKSSGDEEVFSHIDQVTVGHNMIDLNKSYKLVTNDFLASGGDGYSMFANKKQLNKFGSMLDTFVKEISSNSRKGSFEVKTDGRLQVLSSKTEESYTVPASETSSSQTLESTSNHVNHTSLNNNETSNETSVIEPIVTGSHPSHSINRPSTSDVDGGSKSTGFYTLAVLVSVLAMGMMVMWFVSRRKRNKR